MLLICCACAGFDIREWQVVRRATMVAAIDSVGRQSFPAQNAAMLTPFVADAGHFGGHGAKGARFARYANRDEVDIAG